LAGLFVGAWTVQAVTGWYEFRSETHEHEQAATFFGSDGYLPVFLRTTMENWQSEFLQLLTFVVLTTTWSTRTATSPATARTK
jgi:hypothetical protein